MLVVGGETDFTGSNIVCEEMLWILGICVVYKFTYLLIKWQLAPFHSSVWLDKFVSGDG
jgi:hypothetical protein